MLKHLPLATLFAATAASLSVISLTAQDAHAFGVALGNQWSYAADSFTDGTAFASSDSRSSLYNVTHVGGNAFEIYGMAMRQDGNTISVALNSNLGVGGWNTTDSRVAQNTVGSNKGIRNIGWGDLIFNFSGNKLSEAAPSQLFGVKFGVGNDSSLQAGLYSNVGLKSTTSINSGWGSMSQYNNYVNSHIGTTTGKNTSSLGELASNSTYFDQSKAAPTSIATGTKVATDNFKMLDANMLKGLGLNFASGLNTNKTLGSQTFGFSFTRTEAMKGNFIASIFEECANDGIAVKGETVPEPTTILGTLLGGFGLWNAKRKRSKMAQ